MLLVALRAAGGAPPEVGALLEQVQVDHTMIDVIVVDERDRLPIGRPYLTAAIDVCSRCLVGMVVTLEAPSAVSVGLCLAHVCCDKRPWLDGLEVEVAWPMSGKPSQLYLDNAAEFKSEALRRGCEQHGITLAYRPPGQPHYGGIVERVIGTEMGMVHELPGTTFSGPAERGGYDAEGRAALTLRELERWLTRGNFRLLDRLFTQIERVMKINELHAVTSDVVEAASSTLVIGTS